MNSRYNLEKQHNKGKLHAIERINLLLDSDSFTEIGSNVSHRCTDFGLENKELPYDGVITGFGNIGSNKVFVYSQDFTVMGGTLGERHGKKITRCLEMAISAKCPIIGINDSGGARIQEGILSLAGYGELFYLNTKASGYIPQVSIIVGPCAGGAVYSPGITDFVFVVDSISKMFVTGPKVIEKVLFQEVDMETLGGAQIHAKKSGVAHFLSETEDQCFKSVRALIDFLPRNCNEDSSEAIGLNSKNKKNRITSIVPENKREAYDVRDIIIQLIDIGSLIEVSKDFAKNIIISFAKIDGRRIGIIANQPKVLAGVIDCDASDKAARFIRFCDSFNIPILSLVDVPGFMPGVEQEYNGIIRHGAKLLFAYSEATVPKITVILRKAYGGAYIAMCSKHLGADFVYAWPNSEIAVMGADGAVEVLYKREISDAGVEGERVHKSKIEEYSEHFANPKIAAELGIVDEIISPLDTRDYIINSLSILHSKKGFSICKKHGNIPL